MPSKPTFLFISAFLLLACLLVSQSGIAQSSRELALLEAVKAGDQESVALRLMAQLPCTTLSLIINSTW